MKNGRHRSYWLRLAARDDRLLLGRVGLLLRDVAVVGHLLQRVVATEFRGPAIDIRALPRRRLNDAGDHRRFFQRHILRALAEVQPRRGLDAVRAVTENHLIAIEREDLALRVALFDLDRDEDLLDLALGTLVAERESHFIGKQVARELHRERARTCDHATAGQVAAQPDEHGRNAEAEVIVEVLVFRRDDGIAQVRRNLVVRNDEPPLGRKLAERFSIRCIHARDRARRVVVQLRDKGQVAGVGEHHAAQNPEQGDRDEQGGQSRMPGEANNEGLCVALCGGHEVLYCTSSLAALRLLTMDADFTIDHSHFIIKPA